MQRRHFLSHALATVPLVAGSTRLIAASPGTPRLLVVFLRGAYDAANLLIPLGSSFYYEQRPNIAIARPGSAADAALPLNAEWGLNPALIDSMLPLFERRQLAFVPFAGTGDGRRSPEIGFRRALDRKRGRRIRFQTCPPWTTIWRTLEADCRRR